MAMSKFDTLVGMTQTKYRESLQKQARKLPSAQIVPSDAAIARRVGQLLMQAELKRVKGKNNMLYHVHITVALVSLQINATLICTWYSILFRNGL